MKKPVFEGVATALVTPFKQGTLDFAVMNQLLDLQLAAGVDAVVVCGTTGEASTMTDNEKLALIAHTVKYCAGRCSVIAGTGTNDTAHTLQLSRVAASMGVDAVLLVTPYYNKCTQAGLIAHYTAAAGVYKSHQSRLHTSRLCKLSCLTGADHLQRQLWPDI